MISQKEIFLSRGYDVPSFYYDADGRQVEIETREDEEQSLRLECIIKLLVEAGYYRAKIRGIAPFDIVVGGMAWCIDSGDIDLDVDLLFEEGLSIGQKIALTEKIVVVLPKIKCPYFIEPHEIQGLNFIQMYPVIEWLINWSRENRERQAAYLKKYARNQFHKNFTNENAEAFRLARKNTMARTQYLMEKFQPRRVATQTDKSIKDIKAKLVSTLAEYGISSLHQSGSNLFNINFDLQLKKELEKSVLRGLSSQDFAEAARKKLNQLKKELNSLKEKKEKLIPAVEEEQRLHRELNIRLEEKTVEIGNLTEEEQRIVENIQQLIKVHETLREEEKSKKESFKEELKELQTAISDLENSTIDEEIEHLQKQSTKLETLLTSKKLELADIARKVTSKERKLERIPTRAELSQYQKRYLELYRIHTLKTAEAKQNIMTYNMLNKRYSLIQKQYNIVNSIHDYYTTMKTEEYGHQQFQQQIESIIEGVVKAKQSIVLSIGKTEETKKKLLESLKKVQDRKTEYAKAVNALNTLYKKRQSLCDLYERLNATCEHFTRSFKASAEAEKS